VKAAANPVDFPCFGTLMIGYSPIGAYILSQSSNNTESPSSASTPNPVSQAASSSSSVPGSYDGLRHRGFPPYSASGVPQW